MSISQRSHEDPGAIEQRVFDESLNAKRVILVGGFPSNFNTSVERISAPEIRIERVEVPVIIEKEKIVYIDKPFIVEKEITVYVDKPVIVERIVEVKSEPIIEIKKEHSIEYVDRFIEKPTIITQTEYRDLPKWARICLAVQFVSTFIVLLKLILK
jgi:hypothetical protein